MSQRRLLLEDDDELPIRRRTTDPWSRFTGIDHTRYDCAPCRGTGWGGFIPMGGVVCGKCCGSGRNPNRNKDQS